MWNSLGNKRRSLAGLAVATAIAMLAALGSAAPASAQVGL